MKMQFVSAISEVTSADLALRSVCNQAMARLSSAPIQLACLFVSSIYNADWPFLLKYIHEALNPKVLIGCSGTGMIGAGQEVEQAPAISLLAAHLPDVRLFAFSISPQELDSSSAGGFWVDKIGAAPDTHPVFVLFADPLDFDIEKLLAELNVTYPASPIVGGLLSDSGESREPLLFIGSDVHHEGALGVAMTGNIAMDAIVSQGCRPVGRPYVITKAEEQVIFELGGRPALITLHAVLSGLPLPDRELAQSGSVFVGLAFDEMRATFGVGDFLIRPIVGLDPDSGAIAVADQVKVGQTLQFHLRDANASRQELRRLLHKSGQGNKAASPAGGLLFNCAGRGKSLYGTSGHDVKTIHTINGNIPIGGFFCSGEIGPIGKANFLHGYTAILGLFRPIIST